MSNETKTFRPLPADLPPDLADIASQLDALGQAARADAPRDFEARLVAGVRIGESASVDHPEPESLPFPVAPGRASVPWRMAASLALSAGLLSGITWIATRTPTGPNARVTTATSAREAQDIAQDLEQFLTSAASWDLGVSDSIASTREAIDLASSERNFWGNESSDSLLLEDTL